jgi:hypothetical protein
LVSPTHFSICASSSTPSCLPIRSNSSGSNPGFNSNSKSLESNPSAQWCDPYTF